MMLYQPWTLNKYEILSRRKMLVREGITPSPFPYSERHLQCAWYDSAFRPPFLFSSEGEKVIIENPGRWNLEAGPDFLDAAIRVANTQRIILGDVEIHISSRDWNLHRHSNNPKYDRVAVHVTFFPPSTEFQKAHPTMMHIPLKDTFKAYPSLNLENIDTTAYPYHNISEDRPPCAQALRDGKLKSLDLLLKTAGIARLRVKARRIVKALIENDPEQVFYEEIMCALGYKNNRIPFRQLAQRVPLESMRSNCTNSKTAYSLLLGTAGLLPSLDSVHDPEARAFARSLWDIWWKMDEKWKKRAMQQNEWTTSGQRPPNHPARRLAAAAALFTDETNLHAMIMSLDNDHPAEWHKNIQSIVRLKSQMPFWEHRLSFYKTKQERSTALIGPRRIATIITNVITPFVIATGKGTEALLEHLPAEHSNSIIRQAASTLLGNDHNPAIYNSGLKQQGLIQIFHDFCLNTRKGCNNCTLAAALRVECGNLSSPNIYRDGYLSANLTRAHPLEPPT